MVPFRVTVGIEGLKGVQCRFRLSCFGLQGLRLRVAGSRFMTSRFIHTPAWTFTRPCEGYCPLIDEPTSGSVPVYGEGRRYGRLPPCLWFRV